MIGDDLAVGEECFWDLQELFVGYYEALADAAPLAVPYLIEILAYEGIPGRAYAGQLLVEMASLALRIHTETGLRCLQALRAGRDATESVARGQESAHAQAARMVLSILNDGAVSEPNVAIERLSNAVHVEERQRPCPPSLPPGADEIATWLVDLRSGKIVDDAVLDRERQLSEMALYLSAKAQRVDYRSMLEILDARPPPPAEGDNAERRRDTQVRWSLSRASALAALGQQPEALRELDAMTWCYSSQASALSSAEHEPGSLLAPALMERVSDPSLRVRRKALEARHAHVTGDADTTRRTILEIAEEWLRPAVVNGANQVLGRSQMLSLIELMPAGAEREELRDRVQGAVEPEIVVPEGDTI
jgi:hypothetical protein